MTEKIEQRIEDKKYEKIKKRDHSIIADFLFPQETTEFLKPLLEKYGTYSRISFLTSIPSFDTGRMTKEEFARFEIDSTPIRKAIEQFVRGKTVKELYTHALTFAENALKEEAYWRAKIIVEKFLSKADEQSIMRRCVQSMIAQVKKISSAGKEDYFLAESLVDDFLGALENENDITFLIEFLSKNSDYTSGEKSLLAVFEKLYEKGKIKKANEKIYDILHDAARNRILRNMPSFPHTGEEVDRYDRMMKSLTNRAQEYELMGLLDLEKDADIFERITK